MMKFNMQIANVEWSKKKNIPMQNELLAFGVADRLLSTCRKNSKQKTYIEVFYVSFKSMTKVGQPFPTRIHLVVGQPYYTLVLICTFGL